MRTLPLLSILTALLLSACAAGPDYHRPATPSTQNWDALSPKTQSASPEASEPTQEASASLPLLDPSQAVEANWWRVFQDKELDTLIHEAARHNYDIRITQSSIEAARTRLGIEKSANLPEVSLNGNAAHSQLSENGPTPILPGKSRDQNLFQGGFDASWELDIFGRSRRSVESATYALESKEEQKRAALLSVLAETARAYLQLRGTQRQITLSEKNIDLQNQTITLIRARLKEGSVSELELSKALAQLNLLEASRTHLHAVAQTLVYHLATLTGREPQSLYHSLLEELPLPVPPQVIPIGLRSDLIERRPDLRAAERDLAAQTAQIGAIKAQLLPRFSLTGNLGLQSLEASDFFSGNSATWALGAVVQWPVFSGFRIQNEVKGQTIAAHTAELEYQKAILLALEDAESALSRYQAELKTQAYLEAAVRSTQTLVDLAQKRYAGGADDAMTSLDAEMELAQREDQLVSAQTETLVDLVGLYKALGGGWEVFEEDASAPETDLRPME